MTAPILLALLQLALAFWLSMEFINDWPKIGTVITILLLVFYSIVFLTIDNKPNSAPAGISSIESRKEPKICEGDVP